MSATRVVKPNRDVDRIIRCCATLIRASHTVEELTEFQRDGWRTIGADARDSCDALRDQVASLERDLAEARAELARANSPGGKWHARELGAAIERADSAEDQRDAALRDLAEARAKLPPVDGYQAGYLCAMEERNKAWRDLAELREAAREAIAANDDDPDLGQGAEYDDAVQFARFCMAMDRLSALLPAEPPKEASDGK